MTALQGLATFPGVDQIISASITLGHGISPSTAHLTMVPQLTSIAEVGTLRFQLGDSVVEFFDCKADHGTYQRSESGEYWQISLVDRRWKWRFGQISGRYNVWREDATLQTGAPGSTEGELIANTERTPRELAELYLEAMGEENYDVSALPNHTRPPVDHEYDNPAEALAELCDSLGCRIVLRLDNTVQIVRTGAAAALPTDFLLEDSMTVDLPEKPDKIAVVCGPSFYQVDFPLEAVGLDRDSGTSEEPGETIRPLQQLSYKPPGGWGEIDLPLFANLATNADEEDVSGLRSLATKSVFRYYRIAMPVRVPGYEGSADGLVTRREQVLPLFDEQVSMALENHDSVPLPAAVFGVWYAGLDDQENTAATLTAQGNSPAAAGPDGKFKSAFYNRGFTLDAARGLVIFKEPVIRNLTPLAAKVTPAPAQLVLRAKCHVRNADTLALERYVRERETAGTALGTRTQYLLRDELAVTHVPAYDPETYPLELTGSTDPRLISEVITTTAQVDAACDHYIDAALEEYQTTEPRQVQAAGLYPIDLDGGIQQVTYQVGPSGATTTVARGSEPSSIASSHGERRRSEVARGTAAAARRSRGDAAGRTMRRQAAARRQAR